MSYDLEDVTESRSDTAPYKVTQDSATPTSSALPLRMADFPNLAAALDYAAKGDTGFNFYTGRGTLHAMLPYSVLRGQARAFAFRLLGLGLQRGERVALVADSEPNFVRVFFACQYAGLVPVPLPLPATFGVRSSYVRHLHRLLSSCSPRAVIAPHAFVGHIREAAVGMSPLFVGAPSELARIPPRGNVLQPSGPNELAYLQYTSGSTRFPRGVMITQEALLGNLAGIVKHGVRMGSDDRCASWLPFYHDMGLVGLVLVPVASQRSVDFLETREFAKRPRQWLSLISRNRATISFGAPFGYELCARRLRPHDARRLDLSAWRVAGVGAEVIRPSSLKQFAERLAPAGFDERAFLACYGMAECTLAVSFARLGEGLQSEDVDSTRLTCEREAVPARREEGDSSTCFVNCGAPLPAYDVEVRDSSGCALPERRVGIVFVRGMGVMSGYFNDTAGTRETLAPDGWLNTGDLGYRIGRQIVITGREKDLIILNGRNVWPQDLEQVAEEQPGIRPGDALAFAVQTDSFGDAAVMIVQCRETDAHTRLELIERLRCRVRARIGIDCVIELASLHTLPRTSSGKLSRSAARQAYLAKRSTSLQNSYVTSRLAK